MKLIVCFVGHTTYPSGISKDISLVVSKVKKDKKLSFLTKLSLFYK
jgi:hypothetical protein